MRRPAYVSVRERGLELVSTFADVGTLLARDGEQAKRRIGDVCD